MDIFNKNVIMTDYQYLSDVSSSHHYFNRKKGEYSAEVITGPVDIIYSGRQNAHYGKYSVWQKNIIEERLAWMPLEMMPCFGETSFLVQEIWLSLLFELRDVGYPCFLNFFSG